AQRRVGGDEGRRRQIAATDCRATHGRTALQPVDAKTPRSQRDRGDFYVGGRPPNRATHAVIGTLRPTERRRAANQISKKQMELRGIEPLTSAVRLQRSPS